MITIPYVRNDDTVASKIERLLDGDGLRAENLGVDLHAEGAREGHQPVQAFEVEDTVLDVEHDAPEPQVAGNFDHGRMGSGEPDREIAGHVLLSPLRSRPVASSIMAVAPERMPSRSPHSSASLNGISSVCSSSA